MATYKARIIGEFELEAEDAEEALESVKRLNAVLKKEMESDDTPGVVGGSFRAVREDMILVPDENEGAATGE